MNKHMVYILLSCVAVAAHAASTPAAAQPVDRWTAENAAPAVSKGGGGQTIALGSSSTQTQVRDLFTPDAQHA